LNNAPITVEEQESLRANFEAMREVLNTSVAGFLHQPHMRSAFDDADDERLAYFEKMWSSPGFAKLSSNYYDLLFNEAANNEWCAFIETKIRGLVDDPATRVAPRSDAPLRSETTAVRHRLLRGVQQAERPSRGPARVADRVR